MKNTVLITGSRAPAALDLARAFAKAGHRVIGAESLSFALSKHSNAFHAFYPITAPNTSLDLFRDDLVKIINAEKVDLLIPTCEEAFHVAKIREQLPCFTLVDNFQKLNQLHSKFEFNQLCKTNSLAAPESYRICSSEEGITLVQKLDWNRFVLKPEFSRFATKTLIQNQKDSIDVLKSAAVSSKTPWVVQNCLIGPEYCTYSVAIEGKLLAHVTYDHEFTAGRGAGICFRSVQHAAIETWVKSFVEKTNYTGQIAFDFIEKSDGTVEPLECNPRATSGVHLVTQNLNFVEAIASKGKSTSEIIRPSQNAIGQLRLAMFVYGLPAVRSFLQFKRWLQIFTQAREVVFSLSDLRPFFDQFIAFYRLVSMGRALKISPLEVSTRDIEWNGGEAS